MPQRSPRRRRAPGAILGFEGGTLARGRAADLCLFDPKPPLDRHALALASQGRNSPFLNHPMQGRVRYTLIDGHIDFESPH